MGRIGKKQKGGVGRNRTERYGSAGVGTWNGHGSQIPTDRTPVPDEDVIPHPSSTDASQIPTASTMPRAVETSKKGRIWHHLRRVLFLTCLLILLSPPR